MIAGPGVIEANEALEDAGALRLGHARSVVVDRQSYPVGVCAERNRDRRRACRAALSRRWPTTRDISSGRARTRPADTARTSMPTWSRRAASRFEHDVVEIDRRCGRWEAFVVAGERQQIVDDRAEPGGFGEHANGKRPAASTGVGDRKATSASVRIEATGERSSWEASEMNRRRCSS